MIWVNFVKKYLAAFAAKDLDQLDEIYSDDITIRDWEDTISGKEQVLMANKHLFNITDHISIHIKDVAYNNKIIFVNVDLIAISGKDKVHLPVMYMVEINDKGKISYINAFKQYEILWWLRLNKWQVNTLRT